MKKLFTSMTVVALLTLLAPCQSLAGLKSYKDGGDYSKGGDKGGAVAFLGGDKGGRDYSKGDDKGGDVDFLGADKGGRDYSKGDDKGGRDYSIGGDDGDGGHAPVPEPATMLLFGTGLVGFAGWSMKRRS